MTADDDPKLLGLFLQAIEIWMKKFSGYSGCSELSPNPAEDDVRDKLANRRQPYNSFANFHRTGPLFINEIKPAQEIGLVRAVVATACRPNSSKTVGR